MVSFLHHWFNVIFLTGGACYYHKDSIVEFLLSQDRENYFWQNIIEDTDELIHSASS